MAMIKFIVFIVLNAFSYSFSQDKIAVDVNNGDYILIINPATEKIDSVRNNFKTAYKFIYGEDILGVWNGKLADYFRIVGDSAHFVSRIKFQGPFSDHIPDNLNSFSEYAHSTIYEYD